MSTRPITREMKVAADERHEQSVAKRERKAGRLEMQADALVALADCARRVSIGSPEYHALRDAWDRIRLLRS